MSDSDTPQPGASASEPTREAAVRLAGEPETQRRPVRSVTPLSSALSTPPSGETKTLCERCGAEMYRMHAVWRCPACGFKTDCCGW